MTWGRYRRCSEEANSFRAAGGVESGQVRLGSAQGRGISAVKAAATPVWAAQQLQLLLLLLLLHVNLLLGSAVDHNLQLGSCSDQTL